MIDANETDFTAQAIAAANLRVTSNIVQAYVSHNAISRTDLPQFISDVYGAVTGLGSPAPAAPGPVQEPAVPIRKSIQPDYLICLEDGMKLKSLKRHLRTAFDMSPEQYRAKWGLPVDYPMVAPNYSAVRSQLAKSSGLGKKR